LIADRLPATTLTALRAGVVGELRKLDMIADVFTYDELAGPRAPERPFGDLFYRSFHPERTADLMILRRENDLIIDGTSTTHGTPYDFDTHVPIVFMGAPFRPGRYAGRVATVDIAPTLARVLHIAAPAGLDGHALEGALVP